MNRILLMCAERDFVIKYARSRARVKCKNSVCLTDNLARRRGIFTAETSRGGEKALVKGLLNKHMRKNGTAYAAELHPNC
jgi:hypothetical protein